MADDDRGSKGSKSSKGSSSREAKEKFQKRVDEALEITLTLLTTYLVAGEGLSLRMFMVTQLSQIRALCKLLATALAWMFSTSSRMLSRKERSPLLRCLLYIVGAPSIGDEDGEGRVKTCRVLKGRVIFSPKCPSDSVIAFPETFYACMEDASSKALELDVSDDYLIVETSLSDDADDIKLPLMRCADKGRGVRVDKGLFVRITRSCGGAESGNEEDVGAVANSSCEFTCYVDIDTGMYPSGTHNRVVDDYIRSCMERRARRKEDDMEKPCRFSLKSFDTVELPPNAASFIAHRAHRAHTIPPNCANDDFDDEEEEDDSCGSSEDEGGDASSHEKDTETETKLKLRGGCEHSEKGANPHAKIDVSDLIAQQKFKSSPYLRFSMLAGGGIGTKTFDNTFFRGKRELVEELREFDGSEELDAITGCVHKRVYVLHGKPGTGKTSIVKAISNMTRRHIIDVPPGAVLTKYTLSQLFHCHSLSESKVPHERKLYVFDEPREMLDVMQDRKLTCDGAVLGVEYTLQDLLRELDGLQTEDGFMAVILTNVLPANLDPAIVRKGRIDKIFEIGGMDREDLRTMYRQWYGKQAPDIPTHLIERFPDDGTLTQADVGSIFRETRNVEKAMSDLAVLLDKTTTAITTKI